MTRVQDEARVGQKNKITRRWARRGSVRKPGSRKVDNLVLENDGVPVPLTIPRQKGTIQLAVTEVTVAGRRYVTRHALIDTAPAPPAPPSRRVQAAPRRRLGAGLGRSVGARALAGTASSPDATQRRRLLAVARRRCQPRAGRVQCAASRRRAPLRFRPTRAPLRGEVRSSSCTLMIARRSS